jgi:hypothetical protein
VIIMGRIIYFEAGPDGRLLVVERPRKSK